MATKTIKARAFMRGTGTHITDQSKVSKADYWTMPVSVMDADIFEDLLSKAGVKVEFMGLSDTKKAHIGYREGYAEHYGLTFDNNDEVGLLLELPA